MPGLVEITQVGKREDLADLMAVSDTKATPFTSMVRKSSAPTNTLFEWLVDRYEKPMLGGVIDGVDVTDYENAAQNRARLKNHVQIKRRTGKVSRLAENVSDVAAVKSEIAKTLQKKLEELKRDIEGTCLATQDAQADDGTKEYKTCALGTWISTAGPTLYPIDSNYRTPSAQVNTTATASLVEDTHIQGMLQSIFDTTGMTGDYVLFAGSVLRRRFTDMTRTVANAGGSTTKVRTFNLGNSDATVKSSTAIFEGDFGTIRIVPCSFIGIDANGDPDTDRGYLLDMNKVHLRYNKLPAAESFEDQGGGPRLMIETVFGLQVDNPLGLGKFQP